MYEKYINVDNKRKYNRIYKYKIVNKYYTYMIIYIFVMIRLLLLKLKFEIKFV